MQVNSESQQVTIDLPRPLYERVQRTADSLHRSIEEVLLDTVAIALPPLADLPADLADDLAQLAFLNDAKLWRVARETLPPAHFQEMDDLLAAKGQGNLDVNGQQRLDQLLIEYETLVLSRGQAAVLLQRRGYDPSDLAPPE